MNLGTVSRAEIPALTKEQIRFGFVPNFQNIRPGDLLLSKPAGKGDIFAKAIQTVQKAQDSSHEGWTHAAVYAGDWRLIEATPKEHVSNSVLTQWIPARAILVRRPVAFIDLPENEAAILGLRLALEAALHQGSARYGNKSAIGIFSRLLPKNRRRVKLPGNGPELQSEGIICSGLFAKCYQIATGGPILPIDMQRTDEPVTPVHLAESIRLVDVDVGWLKLRT